MTIGLARFHTGVNEAPAKVAQRAETPESNIATCNVEADVRLITDAPCIVAWRQSLDRVSRALP